MNKRRGKNDNFTPNRAIIIYISMLLPNSVTFSYIYTIAPRFFKKISGKISGTKTISARLIQGNTVYANMINCSSLIRTSSQLDFCTK